MKESYTDVAFSKICGLFGKTRQAWYDTRQRAQGLGMETELVLQWVDDIRLRLPRIGTAKLYYLLKPQLQAHHIKLGRDGFYTLLAQHNLLIKRRKKRAQTTMSTHRFRKWPNLIEDLKPTRPDQLWVSDITYLNTENGFVFLSLVTDAYSRMIVGYHVSQYLKASGCIAALKKAIKKRRCPQQELIHHSDRGIQYCCDDYIQVLQNQNISISMTQSGSPYDNAIAERVNGILKQEFDLQKQFPSYKMTVQPVADAIHAYNQLRPHMSCGMKTPAQKHYI